MMSHPCLHLSVTGFDLRHRGMFSWYRFTCSRYLLGKAWAGVNARDGFKLSLICLSRLALSYSVESVDKLVVDFLVYTNAAQQRYGVTHEMVSKAYKIKILIRILRIECICIKL